MSNTQQLVDRYVAVWNEADADRRRQGVAEPWGEDAVHILEPPQQVRDAAADLEVTSTFQARGHRELEARVRRAYQEFVAAGRNSFRPQDSGARLGDVVTLRWEMVTDTGEVAGGGLEFVVLGADGRIPDPITSSSGGKRSVQRRLYPFRATQERADRRVRGPQVVHTGRLRRRDTCSRLRRRAGLSTCLLLVVGSGSGGNRRSRLVRPASWAS